MQFQLDRDPGAEFVIVSGIPARLLGDICDSARNSKGSPEDFYRYQIQAIGKDRHNAFRDFCRALNLNPEDEMDRAKSYDYLRRTRVELYPDDNNTWCDLLTTADFLLTGKPETVVATLFTYAENNDRLGTPIYPDELRGYLETQSIYPKQLAHDCRIAPAIVLLITVFVGDIGTENDGDILISPPTLTAAVGFRHNKTSPGRTGLVV